MKNIFYKFISLICVISFLTASFGINALAAGTKYAVSVAIISDNITLAQYTVSCPQTATAEALGGNRAKITADENGRIISITVNGKTLLQDEKHSISVLHNNKATEHINVKVSDGDLFVFRYTTNYIEKTSSVIAKVSSAVTSKINTSSTADKTASKTVISSEAVSSVYSLPESDLSSELSSEEISSEEPTSSELVVRTSSDNPNRYKWDDELEKILDDACSWLAVNDNSIMQLIALSAAGQPARANAVDKFLQTIKKNGGNFSDDMQLFYAIISSTFSGIDAENVRNVNLIQKMIDKKSEYLKNSYYASMMLLALDSNGYLTDESGLRREIVEAISKSANKDGGFSRNRKKSNIGDTAVVLTALSPYKSIASDSISNAVAYMSQKIKSGLSDSHGIQIAKTIIAINSLEMDMNDRRFLNSEGKSLVDVMKMYVNSDGGFAKREGEQSNASATEYFVLALVSLENGTSPYIINYQSRSYVSSEIQNAKRSSNFYLSVIILIVFAAVVTSMAVLFIYAKKRNVKSFGDSIKIIFENKTKK